MAAEQPNNVKKPLCAGLLAHVDAGKTTLSEAMLYEAGARRTLGRVDHQDAFLDTHALERARGITIFSKQALLETAHRAVTLVDTPGHVDFSAEAERIMPVLDCAVLVISGTDGVQAHTLTLWRLLERYQVPTFLFLNKMDLPGMGKAKLLAELRQQLSPACVDFTASLEEIAENAAMCDEALLENYLETGGVTAGNLRALIAGRKLFPCCFGSGLKLDGVGTLLDILDKYAPETAYPGEFAAKVYKISRDPQGNRLTWLKVTGGSLKVRSALRYVNQKNEPREEKIVQLRRYSADKFTAPEEVAAGQLAAVTGLSETYAGQSLGAEPAGQPYVLEPVMTYRVNLPGSADPAQVLPKLRQLEEEEPQLRLLCENGQIHVQMMGRVQQEVFRSLVQQRFALDVTLSDQRIFYKETIENTVEGVGHFEPLRHYAEVHLLLEPLPAGSGLVFDTVCPTDVLDVNYQRLILTHLEEKVHRGVLVGGPITDMKITLLVGKAHLKHTEGGDFRQATYRAVRQGLMQAKSVLLEPWYEFCLTMPTEQIGRAITDIRAMGGEFDAPEAAGALSTLKGLVPASEIRDYADTLAAYTQGLGRMQLTLHGYAPCHNTDAVVAEIGYDPEADLANTPDSVFCAHGAGFTVKWDQVKDYMHLESGLKEEKAPEIITRNVRLDDKELEKIMEREFGPIRRPVYGVSNRPAADDVAIRTPRQKYIIVDGYNVIFAWEDLAAQAK
ncbi:MAG: GTP-binding protein, partial [Oscillospiraceae bacterium]